jgi:ABC-type multidrug transport system ATPase subunit
MDQAFIDILKQIVKEQGNTALTDKSKCKSILSDYTRNEYKKESRFLIQAVEAGIAKSIDDADDLPACKKGTIRELEEDHGLNPVFAADIVNALALVLRGDTTITVSPTAAVAPPLSQTAPPLPTAPSQQITPPPAAPSSETVKYAAAETKKTITPSAKRVELISVTQVYPGHVRAVDNINLVVGLKEFVVLLGPPNSGKSTILRLIAGLDHITEGELFIDGELMNDVPAYDRNVKMTSQDYAKDEKGGSNLPVLGAAHSKSRLKNGALALQMTAYENMAYDLEIRRVPKYEIDKRVQEWAKLLDVEKVLDRKIMQCSLPQRWRVALGRSLVLNTKAHLFDDPFAGIDADNHDSLLRNSLRKDLFDLQRRFKLTVIYATRDQSETTSALSDRIVYLKDGKVV